MDNKDKYSENSGVLELQEKDFNGTKIIHSEILGNFGLLKVYAPWCGYCNRIVDDLIFLAEGLSEENFKIAAVNIENRAANNDKLRETLGVKTYPTLFFINSDGTLEKYESDDRSIETLLRKICTFTKKCCTRKDGKINCQK